MTPGLLVEPFDAPQAVCGFGGLGAEGDLGGLRSISSPAGVGGGTRMADRPSSVR